MACDEEASGWNEKGEEGEEANAERGCRKRGESVFLGPKVNGRRGGLDVILRGATGCDENERVEMLLVRGPEGCENCMASIVIFGG